MDGFTGNIFTVTSALYLVGAFIVVLGVILVKPILFPKVIKFPWADIWRKEEDVVILAGSYNPPHLGHLAMLEYLSKRYKRVVAVIGFNPNKKYSVTPEQRKLILEKMLENTRATNIEIAVVDGYIWRYAKRNGMSIFFRGIRSWEKDGKDERALQILNTWGPLLLGPLVWPVPTMYLEGNPKYNHVSSTVIRSLCSKSGTDNQRALEDLVPPNVVDLVANLYSQKEE